MADEVKAQAYPLVTKEEAKALGLKVYTLGTRSCKYGHPVGREVCSGRCKICSDALSLKWRSANPDKRKQAVNAYRQRNLEVCRARQRVWNAQNPDIIKEASSKWCKAHPEKAATQVRKRNAIKRQAEGWHNSFDVEQILQSQGYLCNVCSKDISEVYDVDHIIPLARGGSNWPSNLQGLCPFCNRSKGKKLMSEWLPADHPALKKR